MVEFTFNGSKMLAEGVKPWRGAPHETPEAVALHMWLSPRTDMDLETACTLASEDGELYDALWAWAVDAEGLTDDVKVALFDTLVRKRPRKLRAERKRGMRLAYIAASLKRDYPHLSKTKDIPDILTALPGAAMDQNSMVNLLNTFRKFFN